ncbi:retention module-containing protein, partial [Pseudomonas sp. PIC25]|uniref:retention module-containing protein n=1 Tax=Pseudomonas sp. PIC25 TaxID=1958773 RepID=UPI00117A2C12
MATLIGVVRQVVGEVYAVASDGGRRLLVEGDRVFAGEQIVTGPEGAISIALAKGGGLELGRQSELLLDSQLLVEGNGTSAEQTAATAPSDQDLTDVEALQRAIAAGADPTQIGEATAAGPGAGAGGAGGGGGGHSFVLLDEVGGAVDPVIGFPTEGLGFSPLFPEADIVAAEPEEPAAPDFTPGVEVIYEDFEGEVIAGPGVVDEAALVDGSNPESNAEQAQGRLIVSSPDGVAAVQVQDRDGNWIDVTNGGTVQGVYGTLVVDAAGNWTYTLSDATQDHSGTGTGAADQVGESFGVRVIDSDGDISPVSSLNITVYDDGPSAANDSASLGEDTASVSGNVLDNDNAGADGGKTVTTPGTSSGSYGQFVLGADGAYT